MLESVHTKAVYKTSHDQLLTTLTILDPEQPATNQKNLVAELDTPTSQFIKFKENQDQFRDSQVPRRETLPVAKIVGTKYKIEANSTDTKTSREGSRGTLFVYKDSFPWKGKYRETSSTDLKCI